MLSDDSVTETLPKGCTFLSANSTVKHRSFKKFKEGDKVDSKTLSGTLLGLNNDDKQIQTALESYQPKVTVMTKIVVPPLGAGEVWKEVLGYTIYQVRRHYADQRSRPFCSQVKGK